MKKKVSTSLIISLVVCIVLIVYVSSQKVENFTATRGPIAAFPRNTRLSANQLKKEKGEFNCLYSGTQQNGKSPVRCKSTGANGGQKCVRASNGLSGSCVANGPVSPPGSYASDGLVA